MNELPAFTPIKDEIPLRFRTEPAQVARDIEAHRRLWWSLYRLSVVQALVERAKRVTE